MVPTMRGAICPVVNGSLRRIGAGWAKCQVLRQAFPVRTSSRVSSRSRFLRSPFHADGLCPVSCIARTSSAPSSSKAQARASDCGMPVTMLMRSSRL